MFPLVRFSPSADKAAVEEPQPFKVEGDLCSLPRVEANAAPKDSRPKVLVDFEKKHGLAIEEKDGKYTVTLKANGKDTEVIRTDATPQGLEKAEKEIARLRDEKRQHLEKVFKVSFSTDGEDVLLQWIEKPDCSWERGSMIKARQPNLNELYGIEAALYRAQPSHLTKDGSQGVKFYFLTDNYYKGDPALAYFIRSDKNNKQAVYFEPGANENKPATEADADRLGRHKGYSIESVTHHELIHNAQYNMGWDTPQTKEKWARKLGWLPYEDPKTHETKWVFRGKKEDLYRYDKDHCKDTSQWCACNKAGGLLDKGGNGVAKVKDAEQFTRDQVTDRALVPPCTWYFVNPVEMFAEGGMKYRTNQATREELLTRSPALYEAVKAHDQEEVNKAYGVEQGSGQAKYIRTPDGSLVKNTPENRQAIQDFEDTVKKKKADKK